MVGVLFLGSFTGLTVLRRQRPSMRFLLEGGVVTVIGIGFCLFGFPPHPILFLVVLYLLTMRVRWLVDAANVLANRGVTQLRMGEPEAAYFSIKGVIVEEPIKPAARYQAAGFYNLGVACLRTKRPQEAERHFRKAIEVMPGSLYALAAEKALARAAQGEGEG